jgi:hypothetical protein
VGSNPLTGSVVGAIEDQCTKRREYVAPVWLAVANAVVACGPSKIGSPIPVARGAVRPVITVRSVRACVRAVAAVAATPTMATEIRGRAIQRIA